MSLTRKEQNYEKIFDNLCDPFFPLFAHGQLDARIDTLDFSQNIIIKNKTGNVDFLIEEVPSIIIMTVVINKSKKDVLLMPTRFPKMVWIEFIQGEKFYYIPAIWIDVRTGNNSGPKEDLHIKSNEKVYLTFWGNAPDMREKLATDQNLFPLFFLTDRNTMPIWLSEKNMNYQTWFKEVCRPSGWF